MTQPSADRPAAVASAVTQWQRELADLGGRNTLLWFRDLDAGSLDLTNAHPGGVAMLLAGRPTKLSDLFREATVLEDARRRARAVRAKTVEMEQERGLVVGYLAIGMASWHVPGAARPPAAPVLLRPCTLRPRDMAQEDFEIDLGPRVELNPALVHYLRSVHEITLDAGQLASLATVRRTFDPQPTYSALGVACSSVPGFAIVRRLVIGTFSTAKLPMVADLGDLAGLADHDIVAALAGSGAVAGVDPGTTGELLVLDADAAQASVVAAVRSGAHIVVEGAPGTGKTQTIANLVAALAADGRRVLLAADKRVAVTDVVSRLEAVGLGGLVLDAMAAAAVAAPPEPAAAADPAALVPAASPAQEPGRELNEHVQALHAIRAPWGVSAYDAQRALAVLARAAGPTPSCGVRLDGPALLALTRERLADARGRVQRAAEAGLWTQRPVSRPGEPSAPGERPDPWLGAAIHSAEEAASAHETALRLSSGGLSAGRRLMGDALHDAGLPTGHTVAEWGRALELLVAVRQSLELFRPEVFDVPLVEMYAATAGRTQHEPAGTSPGWWTRRRLRDRARALLRPGPVPADLHDRLGLVQQQREAWAELAHTDARPLVPVDLDAVTEMYAALAADLHGLAARLAGTAEGDDLTGTALDDLQARLADLAARRERLEVLPSVSDDVAALRAAGLWPVVEDFAERHLPLEAITAEMDLVWWTSVLANVSASDERYGGHDGARLHAARSSYVTADRGQLADAAERIASSLRQGSDIAPACWAMSPLAVASVLPVGARFDVVIFDEASRIGVAESISAIARAQQVVVVGDSRQVGPTPFSVAGDDPEPSDPPRESVIDALSRILPVTRLTTHYRSVDERLFTFANAERYAGSLATSPGVGLPDVLVLDGGVGSLAPVERVVDLVLQHGESRADESLGVVTMDPADASAVADALRLRASGTPVADQFFDEKFFVKGAAAAQGEVRDAVILLLSAQNASGDARASNGEPAERLLTVATTRARRRLTVVSAGTHADQAADQAAEDRFLAYVSDHTSDDGSRSNTGPLGRDSHADPLQADPLQADPLLADPLLADPLLADPLLADLAGRLRAEGLVVRTEVGASAYPLELVVDHPAHAGLGLLVVETDGPRYAAQPGTRDRDRLRQEQLERIGWAYARVWSTDLFQDLPAQVERITALVAELTGGAERVSGLEPDGAPAQPAVPEAVIDPTRDDTDAGWGERSDDAGHDRWLEEQRPPHWD